MTSGTRADEFEGVKIVTVRYLANYLREKLNKDRNLQRVAIQGELSKPNYGPTGHLYFKLVEANIILDCFASKSVARKLAIIKHGDSVIVYGQISTYQDKSTYQLDVKHVELTGVGRLYQRREELRRQLQAEGLFADSRRRKVPRFPTYIALVGSSRAQGTRDFRTKAQARAPHVLVRLFETPVQGNVADQIIAALDRASRSSPDYIVITRGGGSSEDLLVFSDEALVRAVVSCVIPIVSAIGHEGDVPLLDLVADVRAMTPTEAAQLLPNRDALLSNIGALSIRLGRIQRGILQWRKSELQRIELRSALADYQRILSGRQRRVDGNSISLTRNMSDSIGRRRGGLNDLEKRILALSPVGRTAEKRRRLGTVVERFRLAFDSVIARTQDRIRKMERRVSALSPNSRIRVLKIGLSGTQRLLQPALSRLINGKRFGLLSVSRDIVSGAERGVSGAQQLLLSGRQAHLHAGDQAFVYRLGRLHQLEDRLEAVSPLRTLAPVSLSLENFSWRLELGGRHALGRHAGRISLMAAQLAGNNPDMVLQRGFAIVSVPGRGFLRDPLDAPPGTELRVRVALGELSARVEGEKDG